MEQKKVKSVNLKKYREIFYNDNIVKNKEFYIPRDLSPNIHIHDMDKTWYLEKRAFRMSILENKCLSIKDIIEKKDYDYIHLRYLIADTDSKEIEFYDNESNRLMEKLNIRQNPGDKETKFASACYNKGGKLIYLGYDRLSENEEVLDFFEWSYGNIKNGITIILYPSEFIHFLSFGQTFNF